MTEAELRAHFGRIEKALMSDVDTSDQDQRNMVAAVAAIAREVVLDLKRIADAAEKISNGT